MGEREVLLSIKTVQASFHVQVGTHIPKQIGRPYLNK